MAQQAETVALPKRLPLIVQAENRDETTEKDARLVNCYVERNKETGEVHVFKRPGLLQHGVTLSGTGRGTYNWMGDNYAIFGGTLYRNQVSVGTGLNTTGGQYRFSSSKGVTPRLQLNNNEAAYNYDTGAGLVAIAGANFPSPPVKGWAYLDATTYVMGTEGDIHGCDSLNDPTAWTDVTNLIEAQIEPDDSVALTKQLVYVIAFKQWSTEVFYDALNATGSPLSPVQGAKVSFGCISADSVQDIGGTLFWLGAERESSPKIIMLEGLKASVVSTKPIDRLLGPSAAEEILSFGFMYEGHKFYGITLKTSNVTLVYDITENLWAQWTDEDGNYFPIVSSTFDLETGGVRLLQHESNGKLYKFSRDYYTDDGDGITCDIYTPNFDGGTRRRKQLNALYFEADRVVGSVLQVRCNDFDYAEDRWTNYRMVDLGASRPTLDKCGTFTRRAYHLHHESNTPMRIRGLEPQIDLGTL
jgi:hypothetical protein